MRWLLGFALLALIAAVPTAAHAAFPGANGKIVFSAGLKIYSVNPDGTDLTHLTDMGSFPSWSADGQTIAFTRGGPDGGVWTMDANGTLLTKINAVASLEDPNWSPDGTQLALWGIQIVNVDGSGEMRITNGGFDPSWSPDGSRIAFNAADGDIYVVNPDGSGLAKLTNTIGSLFAVAPDWSPDGTRLVFATNYELPGEGAEIYTMNADGSNPTRLTFRSDLDTDPAWSPDGQMIVFFSAQLGGIAVMNADGTNQHLIAPAFNANGDPNWQPIPLPEPERGDYKNASAYCNALRQTLGETKFSTRYKNHGKCVSANH